MHFQTTPLAGLLEVSSDAHRDHRGLFRRTWCADSFAQHGIRFAPKQHSLSENTRALTLRGMHFQQTPSQEQKLVRCIQGEAFDVVLDLREGSATWGQHWCVNLSAQAGNALFIPRGFAHGFLSLTDQTVLEYLIDTPHEPHLASGVRWNDPRFAIPWPANPLVVADKDQAWPLHA